MHITGRLQTRRWDDPDTGEVRLRTEIIAGEVIFLGGVQQSRLPPDYYRAEPVEAQLGDDGHDLTPEDVDSERLGE